LSKLGCQTSIGIWPRQLRKMEGKQARPDCKARDREGPSTLFEKKTKSDKHIGVLSDPPRKTRRTEIGKEEPRATHVVEYDR
jgi:hypothetical protein